MPEEINTPDELCQTREKTPEQKAAAQRRDHLLEVAKVTGEIDARRALQEQAEREAVLSGERRIYREPWVASLRVRILPRDPDVEGALQDVPHLEVVDFLPDVTLELIDDVWYLTDMVHRATPERALLSMTRAQAPEFARRVLERYYRLAIPLRLAETAQLQNVLNVVPLGEDAYEVHRPNADGIIEVRGGAPLMVRVTNHSKRKLRLYALNAASSGRCQVLGSEILDDESTHTFRAKNGGPWRLSPGRGRTFAIDRFVILGTTSLYRDLGTLLQDEPFVSLFSNMRSGGTGAGDPPELEEWAATNLVFQITGSWT